MKRIILTAALIIMTFAFTAEANAPSAASRVGGYFYTALTPYGVWMEIGSGVIAWRPTIMARGWQPYSAGRWIWTVDGWYWDSYEDFGYITYHYGRWHYDDYYGWIWIPDYEWAPAWVEWRYDDMYIGWAPLPPYALFSVHIGIHYTYDYHTPYGHWHFIKYNHFYDPHPYKHYVASKYKHRIHGRTKYRTNYDYRDGRVVNRGVDYDFVKRRTGRDIETRQIERFSDPGKVRGGNGRGDAVRTFVIDREQVKRERGENFEVSRSDRKVNLDISRVELGDRRGDINEKRDYREVNGRKIVNERKKDDEPKVTGGSRGNVNIENVEPRTTERMTGSEKNNRIEGKRNSESIEERKVNDDRRNNDSRTEERNGKVEQRNNNEQKRNSTPPVSEKKENRNNTTPKVEKREESKVTGNNRTEERTYTPTKRESQSVERVNRSQNNGSSRNKSSETGERRR